MKEHRRTVAAIAGVVLCAGAPCQENAGEVLETLREGNRRFAEGRRTDHPRDEGYRRTLARAQRPLAVVVTCSDSRVAPEFLFDSGLGEIYTVRAAGNVCSAESLAGVELAVERLGARLCIVLAHDDCAVVRHCAERLSPDRSTGPLEPAYQKLLDRIEPALRKAAGSGWVGAEMLARAEEENAHETAHEMLRKSPVLQQRQQSGHLRVLAARYDQSSGLVEWLPERPLPARVAEESPETPANVATGAPPHLALRMLQAGHRRFVSSRAPAGDVSEDRRRSLEHGRHPFAVIVTCADSRVPPEILFDAGLGDLHVVRVPATAWSEELLATVEQTVRDTGVSLCVVVGHRGCDALAAAAGGDPHHRHTESMRRLVERLDPVLTRVRGAGGSVVSLVDRAAAQSAVRVVRLLREESVLLRRLEGEGRFAAAAALYDPGTGEIEWVPEDGARTPPAVPVIETVLPRGPDPADTVAHFEPPLDGQPETHVERDSGKTAVEAPRPAPPPRSMESQRTGQRLRNHDLAMLVTLVGMLTVLGTGLLIWQRQNA